VFRFASDSLRVNDERVLMMTGAQYFALALLPTAAWIFLRVRKQLAADEAAGMVPGIEDPVGPGAEAGPDSVVEPAPSEGDLPR
jgi:hypothetical protein